MAGIRDEALLFLIAFDDRMNGNAGENQKQDKDQKQTGKADQPASPVVEKHLHCRPECLKAVLHSTLCFHNS